jgi:hypothetical protein
MTAIRTAICDLYPALPRCSVQYPPSRKVIDMTVNHDKSSSAPHSAPKPAPTRLPTGGDSAKPKPKEMHPDAEPATPER